MFSVTRSAQAEVRTVATTRMIINTPPGPVDHGSVVSCSCTESEALNEDSDGTLSGCGV